MNLTYQQRLDNKYEALLNKEVQLFITNVCNLSCGGCHQMCGYIPKDKLFFTPLEDIEWMIDIIIDNSLVKRRIGIFGGEPTLHPKFNELVDIMASKSFKFTVFTNGRLKEYKKPKNVVYRINTKEDPNRLFTQTWNAPKDFYKVEDHAWYFRELAQKYCFIWNNCRGLVYNKKAYACVTFATIDILTGEDHGWEMKKGEDVFVRTFEEIECQAKHYCYRCGHCMKKTEFQKIGDATKVSPTNLDLNILKDKIDLVQIQLPMI